LNFTVDFNFRSEVLYGRVEDHYRSPSEDGVCAGRSFLEKRRFTMRFLRLVLGPTLWARLLSWVEGSGVVIQLNNLDSLPVPLTVPLDINDDGVVAIQAGEEFMVLGDYKLHGLPEGLRNCEFREALAIFYPEGLGLCVKSSADLGRVKAWLEAEVWPTFQARTHVRR
jgi:hypothetical protein